MAAYQDKGWVCLGDIEKDRFYVYALYDTNGYPFYIGKGKNYRVNNHVKPSERKQRSHKTHKINKILSTHGYLKREILCYFDSEESAYECEKFLISSYGLSVNGGILTNVLESYEEIPDLARKRLREVTKEARNNRVPDSEVLRVYKKWLDEFISLEDLAKEIGMSPRTLHCIFNGELRKDLGLTKPSWVPDLRKGMSKSLAMTIWQDSLQGHSRKSLSDKYGISATTIGRICSKVYPYNKVYELAYGIDHSTENTNVT